MAKSSTLWDKTVPLDNNPYRHTTSQIRAYGKPRGLTDAESLGRLNALISRALERMEVANEP